MENGEMYFYNSSFIDFRVSYMNKICLVKPYQILHFFIKRYFMKTLWATMMSPGDKMLILTLSVAKEHGFVEFFQSKIMFCNHNERQKQSNQMICDRVTMIYPNLSSGDYIFPMMILHLQTDITDYQPQYV